MLSLLQHLRPKLLGVVPMTSPLGLLSLSAGGSPERSPGRWPSPMAVGRWGWGAACGAHADCCVGQDGAVRALSSCPAPEEMQAVSLSSAWCLGNPWLLATGWPSVVQGLLLPSFLSQGTCHGGIVGKQLCLLFPFSLPASNLWRHQLQLDLPCSPISPFFLPYSPTSWDGFAHPFSQKSNCHPPSSQLSPSLCPWDPGFFFLRMRKMLSIMEYMDSSFIRIYEITNNFWNNK